MRAFHDYRKLKDAKWLLVIHKELAEVLVNVPFSAAALFRNVKCLNMLLHRGTMTFKPFVQLGNLALPFSIKYVPIDAGIAS